MGEMKKGAYSDVAIASHGPLLHLPQQMASKAQPWRGLRGQRPPRGLGRSPNAPQQALARRVSRAWPSVEPADDQVGFAAGQEQHGFAAGLDGVQPPP